MTKEEFIKVLDRNDYSYEIEGNKLVVTREGNALLHDLASLPDDVVFRNKGHVHLDSLPTFPPNVVFENEGHILLNSLTSIPPGIVFGSKSDVYLKSLMGEWSDDWEGNIKGIESKRLLNKMISLGLFEK
jgi:hypothetical protein